MVDCNVYKCGKRALGMDLNFAVEQTFPSGSYMYVQGQAFDNTASGVKLRFRGKFEKELETYYG